MRYIYTAIIGNRHKAHWDITRPMLRKYADQVDAELVILEETTFDSPWNVLFDAFNDSLMLHDDDDFVWMDNDILINPKAENLFDYPDKFMLCWHDTLKYSKKWKRGHRETGVQNFRPLPCTGIVKWSKRHVKGIYEFAHGKEKAKAPFTRADMPLLAQAIFHLELPFSYFPMHLHKTWKTCKTFQADVSFFHIGGKNKVPRMKKIIDSSHEHNLTAQS